MKKHSPMYKFLTGFRLHCVAEAKSPQTTRWYEHKLRIFANYLYDQHAIDDPKDVEADHVREFLVHLREDVKPGMLNPHRPIEDRPLSGRTIQDYHRSIRIFFTWLVREGHLEQANTQAHTVPAKQGKVISFPSPGRWVRRVAAFVGALAS